MDHSSKKRHRLRTTIIVLIVVFVILPLAVLGWTGVYQIPVVSAIFGTNKPIDLGIHPTAADLASAEAGNPMTITSRPGEFRWTRTKTFSGTVAVSDEHTSAEVTAFIKKYHGDGGHVRDIQVKFREGGMEISSFVLPYIKAPAYVDVDVARTSATSVSLNLRKAKVGRLDVPEQYYDDIEKAAERIINREMSKIPGFRIDELDYRDGTAYLNGALPANVGIGEGEQTIQSLLE